MKELLIPVLLALASCSVQPSTETFVMSLNNVEFPVADPPKVLEVPSSIKAGDALTIRVSVAFGGCEQFSKFESKRTNDKLELTPIGSRQLNVACIEIYGTKWVEFVDVATPARSSLFTVTVRHGNGTDLERTVSINP